MSDLTLTGLRLHNGVWEGQISAGAATAKPEIEVLYLDRPVATTEVTETSDPGIWELRVKVPAEAIADGVQTFVIVDTASGNRIGDFSLIAGDATAGDLRAELELLRAELDMLKRAFRRHCLDSM